MADSDWDSVTVLRKKKPTASQAKSSSAVNDARRKGASIDTSFKYAAGTNKQHSMDKNTARLAEETEELHHDKVSMSVGKAIMKARNEKKLTQKDLATRINEKPSIIQEYESSKAIPNQQILGKLERVLGVKLRGKNIGEPLASKPSKK
ncbi:uncharacterized protein MONBRDRAFT_37512 [Monosiga brevicollis MX1]|uniref:HTH cro/C1-type domain-containing protein n=1 Tax=Monosiga brevicollis TaxID=81824 RepID=A9V268_MONBE|nr:uncharacterized protein MONBRDRAFT_37512 [Monosiga brevicollis MX1]EDQ88327.1 predicted protein [Monosiga brevicollis MX1]|eukprot:XP_001746920.1 hypothetical protein [Monosiga brevicollis MX1]